MDDLSAAEVAGGLDLSAAETAGTPGVPGPVELSLDRVHERIRRAIISGELAPGTTVSQVQLSRSLGVSRTTLREALRLLQREGLVDAEPNRRVRVATFSMSDLEQLYALRVVNEALAARVTVLGMTQADLAALERAVQEMDVAAAAHDVDGWEAPHRTFHALLVRGVGTRLTGFLAELADHSRRYRRVHLTAEPRAWTTGGAEHAAILEACRRRDPDAVGALLARHLARTALSVVTEVAPEHDPQLLRMAVQSAVGDQAPDDRLIPIS